MAYSAASSDDSLFDYEVTPAVVMRMSDTGELMVTGDCGAGKRMFPCPLSVNWCMFKSEMKR